MHPQEESERPEEKKPLVLRIQFIDEVLIVLGAIITILGVVALLNLVETRQETAETRDRYEESVASATDLMEASDYLTTQARLFVATGDETYMDAYLDEILNTRRRDHAVSTLKRNGEGTDAVHQLALALDNSNELAERELYAMRLVAAAKGLTSMPERVATVNLTQEDQALNAAQQQARAEEMVFGYEYDTMKSLIVEDVDNCATALVDELGDERSQLMVTERRLQVTLLVVLLTGIGLLMIAGIANYVLAMRPIISYTRSIERNEPLDVRGSVELRNVATAYNRLYAENLRRTMLLKHQAETDPLTSLLNRGSFDRILAHHGDDIALLMVDVDSFKQINDAHGHEMGDAILKKVGSSLVRCFRNTDYVCRIGGDEFAVVLTEMGYEMRSVVAGKLEAIFEELHHGSESLPSVSISVGIAFSATLPKGTNIYRAADKALYDAKRRGKDQYVFYEDV